MAEGLKTYDHWCKQQILKSTIVRSAIMDGADEAFRFIRDELKVKA